MRPDKHVPVRDRQNTCLDNVNNVEERVGQYCASCSIHEAYIVVEIGVCTMPVSLLAVSISHALQSNHWKMFCSSNLQPVKERLLRQCHVVIITVRLINVTI